jgi:hypothetical protein
VLTLRRIGVLAVLVTVGVFGMAAPAFADTWGRTDCQQTPAPVCDLGTGTGGTNGQPGDRQRHGDRKPNGADSDNSGTSGDTIVGGESNLANCSYVRSDFQPPAGGVISAAYSRPPSLGGATVQPAVFTRHAAVSRAVVLAAPALAQPPGQRPGAWYVWKCTGPGVGSDAFYRTPVWIPDGQPGAVPSPADLAAMARRQLRLPVPSIAANPAGDQLVNLPTWMWLSGGWGPVSATASVPGVSVTAVATPVSVAWSMGDGATVTCSGAGTPFQPVGDPKAPSPDCGHTYRTSSAGQPGHVFPVAATVHWTVAWSGAGQSGTFPDLTTAGNTAFRVAEAQALNNSGGG